MVVFLGAALVLFVVPGPAVLYIVTRSVTQGRRAGLVSVLGIHVGSLVHIAAAVVGLSALVLASATAFTVVKWAGVVYLVYLGVRTLVARDEQFSDDATPTGRSMANVFWQGVFVNVLNPKTAVFFIAFVPQFVDPAAGSTTTQILVLGALFVAAGMVSDGIYALAAGSLGERLLTHPHWQRGRRYVAGTIYLGLGAAAALAGRPAQQ